MQPQGVLIRTVLLIRKGIPGLTNFVRSLGWKKGGAALVALVFVVAFIATRGGDDEQIVAAQTRTVTLKTVAELSSQIEPLSIVGQVSSKSEATVRAESSGQVIGVYRTLGDNIGAGGVVAEIENASQRAAVLQAQGSVDAAQANLSKISGGARSEQRAILEANLASAEASHEAALTTAVNALLSAFAAADNAISGTDKMFSEPQLDTATFLVTSSDGQLTAKVEHERLVVRKYIRRQADAANSLSAASDLSGELQKTADEVRAIRNYIDLVVSNLNKGIPTPTASATVIATYLAEAIASRTSLTTSLATLSSAAQGLTAAEASVDIAKNNLEQGIVGGQSEDIAGAQAALKQAQGALAGAQANLEKTIIRAPISGTVNSFSLKKGDYVQQSTPVLTVANNGALEVLAFVTENDAKEITVGQPVGIELARGVVTRIAPALDPVTKKIEVRIGVSEGKGLINGQSVLVSIPRVQRAASLARITIPISTLKMESNRVLVFTVENGALVSHEVVLGTLLGERVVVVEGLTPEMTIVTDARGLREGQEISVDSAAQRVEDE